MEEIVLTAADIVVVNPKRLVEELEAALGYAVQVVSHELDGRLAEARIGRVDGLPFPPDDRAVVYAVVAAHDPAQLSSREQDALDRRIARDAAGIALADVNADALRALFDADTSPELACLASVVADLIEYGR